MKTTILILLSIWMPLCASPDEKPSSTRPTVPPGMTGKQETFAAKIKKVYRTKSDSGAVYQAFVVDWKNSEIVVQDMFGRSTKEVGDTVTVMVHEIDMPDDGKRIELLQFMCMDFFAPPR